MTQNNIQEQLKDLSKDGYGALLPALDTAALVSITDKKGDIIFANQKFIETFGYTLEELLGQNHRILKSGKQSDGVFEDLWKTISHGHLWRGEILNRAKNGDYYRVDTSITPILDDDKRPERYISIRFVVADHN